MRDRIEKRLLKFFGLARNLGCAAFFQGALLVHEKRELRGESVQKFSLLDRRRVCETNSEYAFGAITSYEWDMQRLGIGKSVCRSSGTLFFLKGPGGDTFIFTRRGEQARPMERQARFVA